jgi:hypothetical protein
MNIYNIYIINNLFHKLIVYKITKYLKKYIKDIIIWFDFIYYLVNYLVNYKNCIENNVVFKY